MSDHGNPCWYELATGDTATAEAFYGAVLGWKWTDSGTPGMNYMLASAGEAMVAGMMATGAGQPAGWAIYFAVDDCDATVAKAEAMGAKGIVQPTDIPGTGRFAVLADPQGGQFSLLQPLPGSQGGAFAPEKVGHGCWNELVSTDVEAALAFYLPLFGWKVSSTMEMGPGMTYHLLAHEGVDFGGAFTGDGGRTWWKPYFGVGSCKAAGTAVAAGGGKVLRGPDEVPGGAFTLQVEDPAGVALGLVGPA